MTFDPIALLEASYGASEEAGPGSATWLAHMAQRVVPELHPSWVCGSAYLATFPGPPAEIFTVGREGSVIDDATSRALVIASHEAARPDQMGAVRNAVQAPGIASVIDLIGALPEGLVSTAPLPVSDSLAVVVHDGEQRVGIFCNVCESRAWLDAATRQLWQRVAVHLGAGWRLSRRTRSMDADDVDAVLEPGGKLAHATAAAQGPDVRDALRSAAKDIDRARTKQGRSDPAAALELWQGLLAGRWSLVDHFDSDGRRYLVARRNDPDASGPASLSRRQRQVVFYASMGWSNVEVGYALGLAENTISAHLSRSLSKLGLRSRAELVRISGQLIAATDGPAAR